MSSEEILLAHKKEADAIIKDFDEKITLFYNADNEDSIDTIIDESALALSRLCGEEQNLLNEFRSDFSIRARFL